MQAAFNVAKLSDDPTAQVGCAICDQDGNLLSVGFNKLKSHIDKSNIDIILNNKNIKNYAFDHAEMVALSKLEKTDKKLDMYITHPSCLNCVVNIALNSDFKFKTIYYVSQGSENFKIRYKVEEALSLLELKGILAIPQKNNFPI